MKTALQISVLLTLTVLCGAALASIKADRIEITPDSGKYSLVGRMSLFEDKSAELDIEAVHSQAVW